MKNKEELFKRKAELLALLAPLGFEDPDPHFLDLVHMGTSLVINCHEVTPENVIKHIQEKSVNLGKAYMVERVRNVL